MKILRLKLIYFLYIANQSNINGILFAFIASTTLSLFSSINNERQNVKMNSEKVLNAKKKSLNDSMQTYLNSKKETENNHSIIINNIISNNSELVKINKEHEIFIKENNDHKNRLTNELNILLPKLDQSIENVNLENQAFLKKEQELNNLKEEEQRIEDELQRIEDEFNEYNINDKIEKYYLDQMNYVTDLSEELKKVIDSIKSEELKSSENLDDTFEGSDSDEISPEVNPEKSEKVFEKVTLKLNSLNPENLEKEKLEKEALIKIKLTLLINEFNLIPVIEKNEFLLPVLNNHALKIKSFFTKTLDNFSMDKANETIDRMGSFKDSLLKEDFIKEMNKNIEKYAGSLRSKNNLWKKKINKFIENIHDYNVIKSNKRQNLEFEISHLREEKKLLIDKLNILSTDTKNELNNFEKNKTKLETEIIILEKKMLTLKNSLIEGDINFIYNFVINYILIYNDEDFKENNKELIGKTFIEKFLKDMADDDLDAQMIDIFISVIKKKYSINPLNNLFMYNKNKIEKIFEKLETIGSITAQEEIVLVTHLENFLLDIKKESENFDLKSDKPPLDLLKYFKLLIKLPTLFTIYESFYEKLLKNKKLLKKIEIIKQILLLHMVFINKLKNQNILYNINRKIYNDISNHFLEKFLISDFTPKILFKFLDKYMKYLNMFDITIMLVLNKERTIEIKNKLNLINTIWVQWENIINMDNVTLISTLDTISQQEIVSIIDLLISISEYIDEEIKEEFSIFNRNFVQSLVSSSEMIIYRVNAFM